LKIERGREKQRGRNIFPFPPLPKVNGVIDLFSLLVSIIEGEGEGLEKDPSRDLITTI
jgi:hypothetical protein